MSYPQEGSPPCAQMAEYHSPGKEVRILEDKAQGWVGQNELTVEPLVPDSEEALTQRKQLC